MLFFEKNNKPNDEVSRFWIKGLMNIKEPDEAIRAIQTLTSGHPL